VRFSLRRNARRMVKTPTSPSNHRVGIPRVHTNFVLDMLTDLIHKKPRSLHLITSSCVCDFSEATVNEAPMHARARGRSWGFSPPTEYTHRLTTTMTKYKPLSTMYTQPSLSFSSCSHSFTIDLCHLYNSQERRALRPTGPQMTLEEP